MRAFLYDTLITSPDLRTHFGGVEGIKTRVIPRQAKDIILPEEKKPFLVMGMGNATSFQLSDSTANDAYAERQFFQIWVHDKGQSYLDIDEIYIPAVKARLIGASHVPSRVITIEYLETSQEFSNETYNTIFRYIRFQAIRGKVLAP